MNIVYCFDSNYFKYVLNSAKSVKKHNKDVNFYMFCNYEMPESQKEEFKGLGNVNYIQYDESELSEFGKNLCGYKHVSVACFIRLLIPKYLPNLQRALYLDGDTVCKGDLEEYYNADFESSYIIGCEGIDYSKKQARELGIEFYINSGVLLFNIPKMNKEDYSGQIKSKWRECIRMPKVFSADETIINYVFAGKIKRINEKYNYCYNRPYTGREVAPGNVIIWHVTGADKRNLEYLC